MPVFVFTTAFKEQLMLDLKLFEDLEKLQEKMRIQNRPNWDKDELEISDQLEALRGIINLEGAQKTRASKDEFARLEDLRGLSYRFFFK